MKLLGMTICAILFVTAASAQEELNCAPVNDAVPKVVAADDLVIGERVLNGIRQLLLQRPDGSFYDVSLTMGLVCFATEYGLTDPRKAAEGA